MILLVVFITIVAVGLRAGGQSIQRFRFIRRKALVCPFEAGCDIGRSYSRKDQALRGRRGHTYAKVRHFFCTLGV